MGLEHVEIFLRVEEEFGIDLLSAPAFPETVGELHDAIRTALKQKVALAANPCPCIPTFFIVRDTLRQVLDFSERIRPSTAVESLLPQKKRRRVWGQISTQLSSTLPPLRTIPRGPIVSAWLGAYVVTLLFGLKLADINGLIIAALMGIPFVSFLVYLILQSIPTAVPAECATVGHLVRRIMPSPRAVAAGSRADNENWHRLLSIISDELDVPLDEIQPDSHFVRDLRCG